ncbi:hypothetical protein PoB_006988800 [Plakobranchus ocellatus]|uniref:Uncharacterized protein n=1 Tax=Plakobranchus ocellatus TaxID=259542 RepID=A0AAV4DGF5_9GAST|nr:hypothetical protein PoB_006988800 [Plakobranchus ocellatus]
MRTCGRRKDMARPDITVKLKPVGLTPPNFTFQDWCRISQKVGRQIQDFTKYAHFSKSQSTLYPTVTVSVCRNFEGHLVSNDGGSEITDKCCTGSIDCKSIRPRQALKALLRNTAGENFVVLIFHLLAVTKLQKVCQMTADEFQQHIWILKQLVRQRQSLQKKKDPACQKEKLLGCLKTVKSLFVFPWHFRIKHHIHINSCARDVLAPAAAAP